MDRRATGSTTRGPQHCTTQRVALAEEETSSRYLTYDLRKLYDQYDCCSLRDGVVHRRWKPSNKAEWQQQIVLPTSVRKDALQSLHDECGHFPFKKTLSRICEGLGPSERLGPKESLWKKMVEGT